jgi:oligopeptidase B
MTTDRLTPEQLGLAATPPVADRKPTSREFHGITVTDDYDWLQDRGYPVVEDESVLAYLNEENAYFEAAMTPHKALTQVLFEELKGRIKEEDESVPFRIGAWHYGWRFGAGAQYRIWYRQPVVGGPEEILLDEPALADGLDYFRLGGWDIHPGGDLLAWSADTNGSERFTVQIKRLSTGEVLEDQIQNTIGSPIWAEDGRSLLYLEVNQLWRPFRVRSHQLGTDPAEDPTLYEEEDASFFVGLDKTRSRQFILIGTGDHVTSEVRVIPASDLEAPVVVIAPRRTGHEYELDHAGDHFYIRTNDTHKNFRVVKAPVSDPGEANWSELIAGSDTHYIRQLEAFEQALVLRESVGGLDQIRIRTWDDAEHYVEFAESAYAAHLGTNHEFSIDQLRLEYESLVTPETVYDYDLAQRTFETRKAREIPSGYDATQYVTQRLMAPARDGAGVPVSIVHHKDFPVDGSGRLHVYAYGAYGSATSPSFDDGRLLSLLDRGFAYAIAHVRGGDEMGYHWYEEGKLYNRMNTFHDFIDASRFLVEEGFATAGNITISGGSAGGELMGAVANLDPDLWRAIIAHVPFVDVLNTMLNADLPLTPIEWPEWGNPLESREAFDYIASYSPYDNVEAKAYPPMLITAGLNDPRVTYWEPAKWIARLRALRTDENLLVLKTNMGAGHGGKSGRFIRLYEVAEEYTFLLLAHGDR